MTPNQDQWTCQEHATDFRSACAELAADPLKLAAFRRNEYIRGVIENRWTEWVPCFMEGVRNAGIDERKMLAVAAVNDRIGDPEAVDYQGQRISPTTAGYLFHYAQLRLLFGPLEGFRIAEIGGGYGGLASVICQAEPVLNRYEIHDLPEPKRLAQVFLAMTCPINSAWWGPIWRAESDLLISSCALSELTMQGIRDYADVLRGAERGFIVWSVTGQSEEWARDMNSVLAFLQSIMPGKGVRRALDIPRFRAAFAPQDVLWPGVPNTFIWGD